MVNATSAQEAKVTLTAQQLEEIVRKVVREELVEFATQEQGILYLDKESPLYKDLEDVLERRKSDQLKFGNYISMHILTAITS